MSVQQRVAVLHAYPGTHNGLRVVYVPCPDGWWHEARVADDAQPGDLLRVGTVCQHLARISAEPFRSSWRSRAMGSSNLISSTFAREQVNPTWY